MNSFIYIFFAIALLVLVLIVIVFIEFVNEFSRELKYLNMEIKRNKGKTQLYWKRKRRRLWLSLIPFFKN